MYAPHSALRTPHAALRTPHSTLRTQMKQCAADLANFIALFLLLLVGFTVSAWHLFGQQLDTYETWIDSFMTNWQFILGEFDWEGMLAAAPQVTYTRARTHAHTRARAYIPVAAGTDQE